jgi:hypothetical protein
MNLGCFDDDCKEWHEIYNGHNVVTTLVAGIHTQDGWGEVSEMPIFQVKFSCQVFPRAEVRKKEKTIQFGINMRYDF